MFMRQLHTQVKNPSKSEKDDFIQILGNESSINFNLENLTVFTAIIN